jgi:hypothetical protein
MAPLARGEAASIYMPSTPVDGHSIELPEYHNSEPLQVTRPGPPVLDNKLERGFITKFAKLKRITDRLGRIVNPHITTKNWDITIQPMLPRL